MNTLIAKYKQRIYKLDKSIEKYTIELRKMRGGKPSMYNGTPNGQGYVESLILVENGKKQTLIQVIHDLETLKPWKL